MKKILLLIGVLMLVSIAGAAGLTVSVSDATGAKNSTVKIPVNLKGASKVGSMDIALKYDSKVLNAVSVEAGDLGKNAFIESNTAGAGKVAVALADSKGISGDGAVVQVSFNVVGEVGSTSVLTLEATANDVDTLVDIVTTTQSGTFKVTEAAKQSAGDQTAVISSVIAVVAALLIFRVKR